MKMEEKIKMIENIIKSNEQTLARMENTLLLNSLVVDELRRAVSAKS